MQATRNLLGVGAIAAAVVLSLGITAVPAHADDELFCTMEWRSIGPSRGGRAQSVAGIPGNPTTYYMGATGGGVWKTEDAGVSWTNVTDGYLGTGSVGAVSVAASDPNVVYVGMGEADVRGNFSHGDGIYKSEDAGKTWAPVDLPVEPNSVVYWLGNNPEIPNVVVAATLFGYVYTSIDGGETWTKLRKEFGEIRSIAVTPN